MYIYNIKKRKNKHKQNKHNDHIKNIKYKLKIHKSKVLKY